jgi:hypothetical protein
VIAQSLQLFGQNIAFLIGILCCCGGTVVMILASWTGLKIVIWKQRQAAHDRASRRAVYDLDGERLPPLVRGACVGCGHVFNQVAELPDGRRFCAHCYRKMKEASQAAANPETEARGADGDTA